MKIVFKSIDFVKMYGDEITYQNIVHFVKTNFPEMEKFNLTFLDEDGDAVTIANEMDVDVMKEMNEGKEIVRIDILSSDTEECVSEKGGQKKIVDENENGNTLANEESKKGIHLNSNDNKCYPIESMFSAENGLFNYQVSKIVEEKIYSLMPCFVNQVQTAMNNGLPKIDSSEDVIHKEVFCSGCSMTPIKGIRYKCLTCHQFNLCQICEEKIMHEHNLLKIRKPIDNEKEKYFPCKFGRYNAHRDKQRHRNTSNNSLSQSDCEERFKSSDPETNSIRFEKITKKMADKFGGCPDLYKEYVGNRMNKRFSDILKEYCTDNNLEMKCSKKRNPEECKNRKLRKLCLYFNKEEKEFIDIVNEFPELSFDDLLLKLKERGTFDFDPQNRDQMKKMKTKLRKETEHSENWMRNSKLQINEKLEKMEKEKPFEIESEIKNVSLEEDGNIFRFDPKEIREKGRILDEMAEIFGKDKIRELYQFIERNFSMGQERMIEKWIETEFEQNKI